MTCRNVHHSQVTDEDTEAGPAEHAAGRGGFTLQSARWRPDPGASPHWCQGIYPMSSTPGACVELGGHVATVPFLFHEMEVPAISWTGLFQNMLRASCIFFKNVCSAAVIYSILERVNFRLDVRNPAMCSHMRLMFRWQQRGAFPPSTWAPGYRQGGAVTAGPPQGVLRGRPSTSLEKSGAWRRHWETRTKQNPGIHGADAH